MCEGDEKENIYINTIDFAQIDAMRYGCLEYHEGYSLDL